MTASTSTDPAVTERGRGALPGRRAHSRTAVGGGDRIGAVQPPTRLPAPIQPSPAGPCASAGVVADGVIGAGRGR